MVSKCVFPNGWEYSAVGQELFSHLKACENTHTDMNDTDDKNLQVFNLTRSPHFRVAGTVTVQCDNNHCKT